jgi:hypothetical protein
VGEGAAPGAGVPQGGPPPAGRDGRGLPIVLVAIVGVLLVGAVVAGILLLTGEDEEKKGDGPGQAVGPPALVSAATAAGCTAQDFPSEGNQHPQGPVQYRSNPPHSGAHNPIPAADGVYDNAPPTEQLVHSLEHGRIVIHYQPPNTDARDELRRVVDEDPSHMILTPNATGMEFEVTATAWTHVLGCPEFNDRVPAAVRAFRDAYRDKGPELVP